MTDLLLEMLSRYGLTEVSGPDSNPEIIEMGRELGINIEDDSTFSWCSIALCYYAKKLGYEQPNSGAARSWLKMPITIFKPSLGDVVVLWRESKVSWKGHVGLFINWDKNFVWLLGGNQNNSISIAKFTRERILGIRQMHKL
jgi:uncharacterized protein (TIGR02594 family)